MRKLYLLFALMIGCLTIQAQVRDEKCAQIDSLHVIDTLGNLTLWWTMNDTTTLAYNYRYRKVGDTLWMEFATLDTFIVIAEEDECIEYEVMISTVCAFDTSTFTLDTVKSFCPSDTNNIGSDEEMFSIYPVPTQDYLNIDLEERDVEVRGILIRDIRGTIVMKDIPRTNYYFSTVNWVAGLYFIELETSRGHQIYKILKL